jgi:hypothetical protein
MREESRRDRREPALLIINREGGANADKEGRVPVQIKTQLRVRRTSKSFPCGGDRHLYRAARCTDRDVQGSRVSSYIVGVEENPDGATVADC